MCLSITELTLITSWAIKELANSLGLYHHTQIFTYIHHFETLYDKIYRCVWFSLLNTEPKISILSSYSDRNIELSEVQLKFGDFYVLDS